ncbi:hypothetical protein [Vibrio owensii]|uniref:hypothetical protein n=1 Tax=Vibrio owensii TaxID=696485 RepID=UPI002F3EB84F
MKKHRKYLTSSDIFGKAMNYKILYITISMLLLVGCSGASNRLHDELFLCGVEATVDASDILYMLEVPDTNEAIAHSVSQYVYRGAKLAAEYGYDKFALVNVPSCLEPTNIGVYVYDYDEELQNIEVVLKRSPEIELLGIFNTVDYHGKRYIDLNTVPGVT